MNTKVIFAQDKVKPNKPKKIYDLSTHVLGEAYVKSIYALDKTLTIMHTLGVHALKLGSTLIRASYVTLLNAALLFPVNKYFIQPNATWAEASGAYAKCVVLSFALSAIGPIAKQICSPKMKINIANVLSFCQLGVYGATVSPFATKTAETIHYSLLYYLKKFGVNTSRDIIPALNPVGDKLAGSSRRFFKTNPQLPFSGKVSTLALYGVFAWLIPKVMYGWMVIDEANRECVAPVIQGKKVFPEYIRAGKIIIDGIKNRKQHKSTNWEIFFRYVFWLNVNIGAMASAPPEQLNVVITIPANIWNFWLFNYNSNELSAAADSENKQLYIPQLPLLPPPAGQ
ncbi:hypothetical protein ACFL57_03730 [Candidatus Margulisiibacteriota bacterium]